METRIIYCSACDREVEVMLPSAPEGADPELIGAVCLEEGDLCTGSMCPICAVPPDTVRAELVRLGLRDPR